MSLLSLLQLSLKRLRLPTATRPQVAHETGVRVTGAQEGRLGT